MFCPGCLVLQALEKAAAFPDEATLREAVKVEEITHMVKVRIFYMCCLVVNLESV